MICQLPILLSWSQESWNPEYGSYLLCRKVGLHDLG